MSPAAFEPMMRRRLHHWQYVAGHMASDALTTPVDLIGVIGAAAPLFLRDPRVHIRADAPIHL